MSSLNNEINRWFNEAQNILSEYNIPRFRWEWNTRLRTRMGRATGITNVIELSSFLFDRADEKQRRETVFHEFAHLIVRHWFGYRDKITREQIKSHGREWKDVMSVLGYPNASRCHKMTIGRRNITNLVCSGCGREINVGPTQLRRIAVGTRYNCRHCKTKVTLFIVDKTKSCDIINFVENENNRIVE